MTQLQKDDGEVQTAPTAAPLLYLSQRTSRPRKRRKSQFGTWKVMVSHTSVSDAFGDISGMREISVSLYDMTDTKTNAIMFFLKDITSIKMCLQQNKFRLTIGSCTGDKTNYKKGEIFTHLDTEKRETRDEIVWWLLDLIEALGTSQLKYSSIQQLRTRVIEMQENDRVIIEYWTKEKAATKIQCFYRGSRVRSALRKALSPRLPSKGEVQGDIRDYEPFDNHQDRELSEGNQGKRQIDWDALTESDKGIATECDIQSDTALKSHHDIWTEKSNESSGTLHSLCSRGIQTRENTDKIRRILIMKLDKLLNQNRRLKALVTHNSSIISKHDNQDAQDRLVERCIRQIDWC